MKSISVLYYAVALFLPILLFVVITDNTNETHPALVWIICPVLLGFAGYLSSIGQLVVGNVITHRLKWVVWSAIIGLVEAALLIYAA